MNRSQYFNYIEQKINFLAFRIESRGKINLLDLNIYSETFFSDLLNLLFDYQLINMNVINQNIEGVDLVDIEKKVIAQVSSTCTKKKVEDSLEKKIFNEYKGYRFKFISISKNADNLRGQEFNNPYNAVFSPKDDIIDTASIIKTVLNMTIEKQKQLFDFIKKELGNEVDIIKVDSNLASILNIIASEDLVHNIESPEINVFEIDKKIQFNELQDVKYSIDDYKIYYHKLDEKYTEFDKLGSNKSLSVFRVFKNQYNKLLLKSKADLKK